MVLFWRMFSEAQRSRFIILSQISLWVPWCSCQGMGSNSPAPWASCCTGSSLHFHYRVCFPWWPVAASKHCSKRREPREEIWRSSLGSCLDLCAQLHGWALQRTFTSQGLCSWELRSIRAEAELSLRGLYLSGHALHFCKLSQPLGPQKRVRDCSGAHFRHCLQKWSVS